MKFNPVDMLKQVGKLPAHLTNLKIDGKMDKQKQRKGANAIIRNHIIWSMGTGLIPVPVVDFFAVSAVQLDMVRQLSKLYEIDFKETEGKAVITSLTGSGLARLGARAAMKLIPGVGTVVGGVTMSVLSGASTYALGEVFREHFETGGTFLDFDPGRLKKYYQEKFEKGKKVARDIKAEEERKKKEGTSGGFSKNESVKEETSLEDTQEHLQEQPQEKGKETPIQNEAPAPSEPHPQDLIIQKIKELAKLKEEGILTEKEFAQMKEKVIQSY